MGRIVGRDEKPGMFAVPLVLVVGLFCAAQLADASDPSDALTSPNRAPIEIFNGKDLSGWTTWLVDTRDKDPRRVFSVVDGTIRISGDGFGYLSTTKAYQNYRLDFEFRWGKRNWRNRRGKARDSGVFLHSVGPEGNSFDGNGAYKAAVECQIMQGAVGDILLIKGKYADGRAVPVQVRARAASKRDSDGWPTWNADGKPVTLRGTGRVNWKAKDPGWKDVLDFRGRNDVESRGDRWTRVQCECRGNRIRVWVNGTLVNEVSAAFPASGKILLQCEGSEVFFRNIRLHPLKRNQRRPHGNVSP